MTIVPPTNSFTPLATIHTSARHVLHPSACNPVMDLVVLLRPPETDGDLDAQPSTKGKERARLAAGPTGVALWRMSGSKVWEAVVNGSIIGLAWSIDGKSSEEATYGLHLTLLTVDNFETRKATLRHLSVHDGRVEQTIPIPELSGSPTEWEDVLAGRQWWAVTWRSATESWPEYQPGTALHLINSLPRVTPVEPPKPAHILPFMTSRVAVDPKTIGPHSKLASFPSLLPARPRLPPDTLQLSPPGRSSQQTFLTGSLHVATATCSPSTLNLALMSDTLASLFDFVLKGIEAAEHAFREGDKQTLIWREEVESCGEQQGMTREEVHADLLRLLTTGRHGPAVGDWLGNRLTGRTIAKWEQSATSAFKTIGRIVSESAIPAAEGVVLLLEELSGWAALQVHHARLSSKLSLRQAPDRPHIDKQATESMLALSTGLLRLLERVRQHAEQEMLSVAEFIKWLRYETTRTTSQDMSTDALPTANYDVKIVWAFLSSGFRSSTFKRFFPPGATKMSDVLSSAATRRTAEVVRPLDDIVRDTLRQLTSPSLPSARHRNEYASPPNHPEDSFTSSHMMSSPDATPHKNAPSRASSPDSLDPEQNAEKENEELAVRDIEAEPWIWATTLIGQCQDMLRSAFETVPTGQVDAGGALTNPGGLSVVASRQVGEITWHAMSHPDRTALWLVRHESEQERHAVAFAMSTAEQTTECVAVDFFDDTELAIILESGPSEQKQLYLATLEYSDLVDSMLFLPEGRDLFDLASLALVSSELLPIPLARCRPLRNISADVQPAAIALNGRKGRRVGCVLLGDGKTLEVLDMDENEDDEGEEDMTAEEGETGEDGGEGEERSMDRSD